MKKILLLGLLVLASCGDDEADAQISCTNKLWLLEKVCDPPSSENCVYFASFGETAESAGTMQVQVATYNHYFSLGATNDGSQCWEGTQEN